MTRLSVAQCIEAGGEIALTNLCVKGLLSGRPIEPLMPWFDHERDNVVLEMPMKNDRADVTIFHKDGGVTVIEAKDGAKGYEHVAQGIGQATLYAAQFRMGATTGKIRRALLWSSTGGLEADAYIEAAYREACALSLPEPSIIFTLDTAREALATSMRKETHGSTL